MLVRSSCVLALLAALSAACTGGGSGRDDHAWISYDPLVLLEGNKVVFEGPAGVDASAFRWSYRRDGDAAFTPIPRFDRSSWVAMVFAEPGDYAVRLTDGDAASTVRFTVAERIIDLSTFTVDPDHWVGAFVFTRSGDTYHVSLRLNDDVLGLIRSGANLGYLYFDMALMDVYSNSLDALASYSCSETGVSVSPQLASLAGIEASEFPDVIEHTPLPTEAVQQLGFVDHLAAYLTNMVDGQTLPDAVLQVEYLSSGPFHLVLPEPLPDELYLVY